MKQQPERQNDEQFCEDQVSTPNSSDTSTDRGSQDQILGGKYLLPSKDYSLN
jgi:hypothetical protein